MASFFISHSSRDSEAAERVRDWLEHEGYVALFLDFDPDRGIPPGRDWESELYSQLRKADVLLFLGTQAAVESKWCHTELAMSRSLGRTILPLRLEPGASHPLVDDRQWITVSVDGAGSLMPLRRALDALRLDALDSLDWDASISPYPGLEPFGENRAGVFYGRSDEIATVLDLLRRPQVEGTERLLLVAGASGSGKSSLVRAGVVPRLRLLEHGWTIPPAVVPGSAPLEALARSLADRTGGPWLELAARLPGEGLASVTRDLLGPGSGGSLLLVIDQAEQLATQCAEADRLAFLLLLANAFAVGAPLRVVATLRSEYLGELLAGSALEGAAAPVVTLGRLSADHLSDVIEQPARRAGIDFEPGLVLRMVEETRGGAGGGDPLPLLAFTLLQLYEGRGDRVRITAKDYDRVGGVVGALKAEADRTLAQLERQGLGELVVPTLLELVHVETERDVAGRTVERSAFGEAGNRVLDAFVEARLLTSAEDEPTVSVAHEALLREWGLLARAIDGSRDRLVARTRLDRDAREWHNAGRDPSYLVGGRRLEEAQAALTPEIRAASPVLAAFVDESERQARRQSRRALVLVAAGLVAAGLVVAGYFGVQRIREDNARDASRAALVALAGGGAVDEHEVTNAAYARCVDWGHCAGPPVTLAQPSFVSTAGTAPVIQVDQGDGQAFCSWIGRNLPSADELRRAAVDQNVRYLLRNPGGREWTRTLDFTRFVTVKREPDGTTTVDSLDPSLRDFDLTFRCAER